MLLGLEGLHGSRRSSGAGFAGAHGGLQQVRHVENGDDLAAAQNGRPGNVPHPRELGAERFHQDFLLVDNLIDHKSDLLIGGSQHDGGLPVRLPVRRGFSRQCQYLREPRQ